MKVVLFIIAWIAVMLTIEEIDRIFFGLESPLFLFACAMAGSFTAPAWMAYSTWYDSRKV